MDTSNVHGDQTRSGIRIGRRGSGAAGWLHSYTLAAVVIWTLIVAASTGWNLYQIHGDLEERARMEARGSASKDLLLQRWIARQGGIYTAVSDQAPPNPLLAHVPERDLTSPSGRQLTLMNAAYFMRMVYAADRDAGGLHGHFTSLRPVQAANQPDAWETQALQECEQGRTEVSSVSPLNGEPYMRLLRPMRIEESCLACHGHQGYKVGDIAGGFSVSVPMQPYLELTPALAEPLVAGHAGIWLLGLAGVGAAARSIGKRTAERRQAQEQREQLLRTLALKNEELENIIYASSHDLRSPLINIEGFSHELRQACERLTVLLGQDSADDADRHEAMTILREQVPTCLHFICSSVERMDYLQQGLLKVCRLGRKAVRIRLLEVQPLVERVAETFEYQLEQLGTKIEIESLPACTGDEEMLSQVFANLIDNAVKYLDPRRLGRIRVFGRIEDDRSVYCVEDNGVGIEAAHQGKVFQMFHRLDPQGPVQGEGIGLTVVRRLMDRQNGTVWVESEAGKGSRFFLSLPRPA